MNFFLKKIVKNIGEFYGNFPLIFTLSGQSYDSKNVILNLDYICHKAFIELQRNLKHFIFWYYLYCKHDKATLFAVNYSA